MFGFFLFVTMFFLIAITCIAYAVYKTVVALENYID